MISTGYNYVGYGAAESASGKRTTPASSSRNPTRPAPGRSSGPSASSGSPPRKRSGHDPLVGRRHAPPGPHRRPALLRGPAASRRWRRGTPGERRPRPRRSITWLRAIRPRSPSPGPRQGRQLGLLADHPHQPLIRPRLPRRSLIARAGACRTWNGAGRNAEAPPGPRRRVSPEAGSDPEGLGLGRGELLVGQDALGVEVGQLLDLGHGRVLGRGRPAPARIPAAAGRQRPRPAAARRPRLGPALRTSAAGGG